jgi:hypothetical protein
MFSKCKTPFKLLKEVVMVEIKVEEVEDGIVPVAFKLAWARSKEIAPNVSSSEI